MTTFYDRVECSHSGEEVGVRRSARAGDRRSTAGSVRMWRSESQRPRRRVTRLSIQSSTLAGQHADHRVGQRSGRAGVLDRRQSLPLLGARLSADRRSVGRSLACRRRWPDQRLGRRKRNGRLPAPRRRTTSRNGLSGTSIYDRTRTVEAIWQCRVRANGGPHQPHGPSRSGRAASLTSLERRARLRHDASCAGRVRPAHTHRRLDTPEQAVNGAHHSCWLRRARTSMGASALQPRTGRPSIRGHHALSTRQGL